MGGKSRKGTRVSKRTIRRLKKELEQGKKLFKQTEKSED
jgi:hypothetical protein